MAVRDGGSVSPYLVIFLFVVAQSIVRYGVCVCELDFPNY